MNHKPFVTPALVALLVCLSSAAQAAAVRYQLIPLPYGDQVGVVDINDHGDILGSNVAVMAPAESNPAARYGDGGVRNGAWVYYGLGTFLQRASALNNAGHVLGVTASSGVLVPTLWVGGEPLDLSDPAHAGVSFVPDAGPLRAAVTFESLDVDVPPGWDPLGANRYLWHPLTNAAGQFVFEYNWGSFPAYLLLTPVAAVPEPSLLVLLPLALVLAAVSSRRTIPPVQAG